MVRQQRSQLSHRFGEMTWLQVREAANDQRVAILPVATIEDHGPHLPTDVDLRICETICDRCGALIPDQCIVIPPVTHGYSPHHLDFPGTLTIGWRTFVDYVLEIIKSLSHHGFTRILVVNGHGGNAALSEVIARQTVVETEGRTIAAALNWWGINSVRELVTVIRESPPGWMSHACELETSMYLAISPELVEMDNAVAEMDDFGTQHFPAWSDLIAVRPDGASAVGWQPYWSSLSKSSVRGDATLASAQKGEQILEAAAEGLAKLTSEFRTLDVRPRRNHHGTQ